MSVTTEPPSFLSADEFELIKDDPKRIIEKAQQKLDEKSVEMEKLKSNIEVVKIQAETKYNQLEQSNLAIRKENELLQLRNQELMDKIKEDESLAERLRNEIVAIKKLLAERDNKISILNTQNEALKDEKKNAHLIIDKKDTEIGRLNDETNKLLDKINALTKTKNELTEKLSEASTSHIPTQYAKEKLEQEKQLLEKQTQWLNNQLELKSKELLSFKTTSLDRVSELELKLMKAEQLVQEHVQQKSVLSEIKQNQELKIQGYIEQLKNLRNDHIMSEDLLKQDLANQSKFANLCKEENQEQHKTIQSLKGTLSQLKDEYNKDKKSHTDEIQSWKQVVSKHQEEIDDLKTQLQQEKKRVQESLDIAPSLKASSILAQGLSNSDIYSMYVKTSEDLLRCKHENKNMQDTINQLMKSVEERAPLLQEQREEYDRLNTSHIILTKKYQRVLQEIENSKEDLLRTTNDKQQLGTKVSVLEQENEDLSRQVQLLLKECQDFKLKQNESFANPDDGTITTSTTTQQQQQQFTGSYVDASAIISEHLVTFANIQELQIQNRKLLQTIRALGSEKEEQMESMKKNLSTDYKQRVAQLAQEIENFKKEREKHAENITSIIKQRDMYKALVEQLQKSQQAKESAMTHQTVSEDLAQEKMAEMEGIHRELMKDKKMIQDELDKERLNRRKVDNDLSRSEAEVQFQKESLANCKSLLESRNKELEASKENNQKLISSVVELQQHLNKYKRDLDVKSQEVQKVEMKLTFVEAEKNFQNDRITQLLTDVEAKKKQISQHENLFSNLQSLQATIEAKEIEAKSKYHLEIETLKEECGRVKKQLEDERTMNRESALRFSLKDKELSGKLESKDKEHARDREEFVKTKTMLDASQEENKRMQEKMSQMEQRMNTFFEKQLASEEIRSGSDNSGEMRILIQKYENDLEFAKEALNLEKENSKKLKASVEALDKQYKDFAEAHEKYKELSEQKMQELRDHSDKLKQDLSQAHESINKTMQESFDMRDALAVSRSDLEKERDSLVQQVSDKEKEIKANEARFNAIKEDLKRHIRLANERQEQYEQELVRHAKDVEYLNLVKTELETARKDLEDAKTNATHAKDTLQQAENSWKLQEATLQAQNKEQIDRINNLARQNEILHSEIETVTMQFEKARTAIETDTTSSITSELSATDKEVKELRELVSFLRKEKEMALTKLSFAENTVKIYKEQLDHLERDLTVSRETIAKMEKKMESGVPQTESAYKEMMQKVNQLAAYQESNTVLRQENERNMKEAQENERKYKQAVEAAEPLKQQIFELGYQLEKLKTDVARAEEEAKTWKARTSELLSKHKQIDPEQHKLLQEENVALKSKIEELNKTVQDTQTQVTELNTKIAELNTKLEQQEAAHTEKLNNTTRAANENTNKAKNLIAKLKKDHEAEIKALKENYEKQIESLNETVKQATDKSSEVAEANTQRELSEKQQKEYTEKLQKELAEKQKDLIEKHQKELADKQNELLEMKEALEKKAQSNANMFAKAKQKMLEMKQKHNDEVNVLKQELEQTKQQAQGQQQPAAPVQQPSSSPPRADPKQQKLTQYQFAAPTTKKKAAPESNKRDREESVDDSDETEESPAKKQKLSPVPAAVTPATEQEPMVALEDTQQQPMDEPQADDELPATQLEATQPEEVPSDTPQLTLDIPEKNVDATSTNQDATTKASAEDETAPTVSTPADTSDAQQAEGAKTKRVLRRLVRPGDNQ